MILRFENSTGRRGHPVGQKGSRRIGLLYTVISRQKLTESDFFF